jgi:hypothetical protein
MLAMSPYRSLVHLKVVHTVQIVSVLDVESLQARTSGVVPFDLEVSYTMLRLVLFAEMDVNIGMSQFVTWVSRILMLSGATVSAMHNCKRLAKTKACVTAWKVKAAMTIIATFEFLKCSN